MSFTKYHMAYAALMHDIGKFIQRTGAADREEERFRIKCKLDDTKKFLTYKHAMWTTEFLYRYSLPVEDWDSIYEVAGCHHNPSVFQQDNYAIYLDYLREADICSSIWDREQPEDYIGKYRANKVALHSPMGSVCLSGESGSSGEMFYGLKPLHPDYVIPLNDIPSDLTGDYVELWKAFEAEFGAMHKRYLSICQTDPKAFVERHFQQYINCAQAMLEKYTWCIPANTTETRPISSLYHHCRNTALIASTLYAAQAVKAGPSMVEDSGKRFMVIGCDLNGIQGYLYDLNPENSRKAAKLLRARSTQVKVIMDLLARRVIDELDLTWQNLMLNVSGKWFILAPANADNVSKLETLRGEIEEDISNRFLGTLSVNLDWSTKIAIGDLNKHHFLNTLGLCIQNLEKRKFSKFKDHLVRDGKWQTGAFVLDDAKLYSSNICPYCHRRPVRSPDKESCPQCEDEIELGRVLTGSESSVFKIFRHPSAGALVRLGDYAMSIASREEADDPYPQTDYFHICRDAVSSYPLPLRAYSAAVPVSKDGTVMEFGEIAQTEKRGLKALSILKGDVDDLSLIFREGLKRKDKAGKDVCSITEYTTFSSMIDNFFSQVVPHRIRSQHSQSIYTVYSGGDDFCLVGAWQDNIRLAAELAELFREFCAMNPELHFSAAVSMLHASAPLRFVIEETEANLKKAKEKYAEKNCFYLFETFIQAFKLPAQIELAYEMDRLLHDQSEDAAGVSKQFLYRLLGYQQMYENTKESTQITRNNLYDALLHYDIRRNIMRCDKNGQVRNEQVVKLFKSFTDISQDASLQYLRIPVCHTLYLNRDPKEAQDV